MAEHRPTTLRADDAYTELERLRAENAVLRAQVPRQSAQIEQLLQRVWDLEARLAKEAGGSPPRHDLSCVDGCANWEHR
jgi:hypothetical protein